MRSQELLRTPQIHLLQKGYATGILRSRVENTANKANTKGRPTSANIGQQDKALSRPFHKRRASPCQLSSFTFGCYAWLKRGRARITSIQGAALKSSFFCRYIDPSASRLRQARRIVPLDQCKTFIRCNAPRKSATLRMEGGEPLPWHTSATLLCLDFFMTRDILLLQECLVQTARGCKWAVRELSARSRPCLKFLPRLCDQVPLAG